jgi:hypothetical protein
MGSCSCQVSAVIEINRKEEENSIISKRLLSPSKEREKEIDIKSIIEEQKKEFPDMEEWEGDKYKGIGIKRMKGYKCNLPIDKLNKKREEFWNTRGLHGNPNYKIWRVINQACVYDEYRANVLLEEYELTTYEGCINHIIDKKNVHYIVPNYCINDPYFEKEFKIKEDIEKKTLKINLYEVATNNNLEVEVNNLMSGEDLKKLFCEKNNISFDEYNIRMFFAGNEIQNNHFLYQYKIHNGYKVQVMKSSKNNDN